MHLEHSLMMCLVKLLDTQPAIQQNFEWKFIIFTTYIFLKRH